MFGAAVTLGPPCSEYVGHLRHARSTELRVLHSSVGSTLVGSGLTSTVNSEAPCTASGFGNGSEGKTTVSVLVLPASGHCLSLHLWGCQSSLAGVLLRAPLALSLSPHPMPTPRTANTLKGKGGKQNSGSACGFNASGICPLGSFSQSLLVSTNILHWHFSSSWQGCGLPQPLHPTQTLSPASALRVITCVCLSVSFGYLLCFQFFNTQYRQTCTEAGVRVTCDHLLVTIDLLIGASHTTV